MAINAHGSLVERTLGRSVMSSFHGFWSVGVLVGSASSAVASHAGLDARIQFAVAAPVLAVIGAGSARHLLADPAEQETEPPPAFALPPRAVLLIGLVGLCAVFGEQAGTEWSAVYIRRELGGSASVAALAVSAFAVMMAAARLVGDRVIRRLGPVRTVRLSGVCATVGAVTVVVAPGLAAGLVGFAVLGTGVALVVPLVFAAAGRVGPHPARSIAGVAGIAYGSGLVAPGVIGGIAAVSSLQASFCLVAGLVALMVPAAVVLRASATAA
jgi:fucose permease